MRGRSVRLAYAIIAMLGVAVAFLAVQVAALRESQRDFERLVSGLEAAGDGDRGGELSDLMLKLQIHAGKLYFAAAAQHWELAQFYLHELEETAESVASGAFVEGGVNVGELMERSLLPRIEALEGAVAAGDPASFPDAYRALTATCNACHMASGHHFVVIREPLAPVFTNQRYERLPASNP